jgi:hypothetical protein
LANLVEKYIKEACGMCTCHWSRTERRRMDTAYVNDESNYCEVCEECFEEIQEHWAEMWADYNSQRY